MTASQQPLSPQKLHQLIDVTPNSYRQLRYDGSEMSVSFHLFNPEDQQVIRAMYSALSAVFGLLRERQNEPDIRQKLRDLYPSTYWGNLILSGQSLGANAPESTSQRMRQVIHDLRGGAFQALTMHMQLMGTELDLGETIHRIFFLARDQLKIMRNALPDLDPEGTARDAESRLHHVDLIVEKWQHSEYRLINGQAEIEVRSEYQGAIAERCLEFSALDRVIYNLINNATTHSAGDVVYVDILPLPPDLPHQLRFVVSNAISDEQQQKIMAHTANNPGKLFQGGFTTGGSGLGLRICADFVSNAYGLDSIDKGLSEGHFGAQIVDDYFVSWVHWPLAAD